MGYIMLAVFSVIALFGTMSGATSQSVTAATAESTERILYLEFGTAGPDAGRLRMMDINGNEYSLGDELAYFGQVYVSPDYSYVGFRTLEGDLYVADAQGQFVLVYPLAFITDSKFFEWRVWGWADNLRLVLSHNLDGHLTFYELDIAAQRPTLSEIAYLNDFFDWAVVEQRRDFSAYGFFHFDPSFKYMATQLTVSGEDRGGEIYFWDILNSPNQPIDTINDGVPWSMEPTRLPAWANRHPALVVFTVFTEEGFQLLIYSPNTDRQVIEMPGCETTDNVSYTAPAYSVWSPDDTRIAYWQDACLFTAERTTRLVIVDVETGEQQVLLDIGAVVSNPAYWSPDGNYLALYTLGEFKVVNVETGETVLSKEIDYHRFILGWMVVSPQD